MQSNLKAASYYMRACANSLSEILSIFVITLTMGTMTPKVKFTMLDILTSSTYPWDTFSITCLALFLILSFKLLKSHSMKHRSDQSWLSLEWGVLN